MYIVIIGAGGIGKRLTELALKDLVTTTNDDATNLMVIGLAKNKGVKHLVSVVNQEESKPMYMEKGVKMVKSPNIVMAEHLYKSIKHPNVDEYMNVGKYAEIFRLPIAPNSKLSRKTIRQIGLPKKALIVAIERDHKFIIPTEDVELFAGDKVTVLAHKDQVDKVAELFSE